MKDMFGLGVAALIVGYALLYCGTVNLQNGGNGPKLFESMGFTKKLTSPSDYRPGQGSGNQIGQVPQTETPNYTVPTQNYVET
jgi:hypothetical protein